MNIIWHILFLGIAFFQMLFMSIQGAVFRRREYLFYIAYIFSASLYILLRVNAATGFLGISLHPWVVEILNQPLAIFSYWMYVCFTRYFLNLKKFQPRVYRYSRVLEIIFIVFITTKFISIPFNLSYKTTIYSYLFFTACMIAQAVPMIVLMLRQKNTLNNFLLMGSMCYVIGGVAGMLIGAFSPGMGKNNIHVMYGLEIGVLIELLLLNTGFMLKNKILQQQVIHGQQKILQQLIEKKDTTFGND
jgi:7TM diverse intracellular signalling